MLSDKAYDFVIELLMNSINTEVACLLPIVNLNAISQSMNRRYTNTNDRKIIDLD